MNGEHRKVMLGIGVAGLGVLAGVAIASRASVEAADHLDPPARTNPMVDPPGAAADRTADIADVYAWHQGTGAGATVVFVLSFAGPNPPAAGQAIPCDRDVLYTLNVSNDADLDAETSIVARFGEDDLGHCFVSVSDVPGATGPIVGPVEQTLMNGASFAYAGLRDDAFFFDLQGFRETLSTGTLAFMNTRDFFAGQNTPAIVLEMPLADVSPGAAPFRVWATTARIGG